MGLDTYIYEVRKDMAIDDFTFEEDRFCQKNELKYWRSNRRLQYFMEQLYKTLGGKECFNNIYLRLTMDRLNFLMKEIKRDREYDKLSKEEDLKTLHDCKFVVEEGHHIYYYSCW